jgi:hypothetical protein
VTCDCTQQDSKQHPDAQEPQRQMFSAYQRFKINMGGVGEQEHHQSYLGKFQETFPLHINLVQSGHGKNEQNPCGGKNDRRCDDGLLQPPRYQTVEKNQRYKNSDDHYPPLITPGIEYM